MWVGVNSASFAAIPDNNMIHFGIYSITPIPVQLSGTASIPEGRVELPSVPLHIKRAILSSKTTNPFKSAYRSIYTSAFLKQLQKCQFVGMPYELDGNKTTTEWIVMTVFYGCAKGYDSLVGSEPHNWILQRDAKNQFRILMESDGTSLSLTKNQSKQKNYDQVITITMLSILPLLPAPNVVLLRSDGFTVKTTIR